MNIFRWLMMIALLICALPFLSVLTVAGIAELTGCTVNEGGATPCLVFGTDIGEMLTFMMVSGWFMLMTLPMAALLTVVWIVVELVAAYRKKSPA